MVSTGREGQFPEFINQALPVGSLQAPGGMQLEEEGLLRLAKTRDWDSPEVVLNHFGPLKLVSCVTRCRN